MEAIIKRRGQAAMEFLMTYGWAILAAIVVIAVLAIYFRPSTLVSGSTFVTAPFYAQASTVSAASGVALEVKNNGGEQVTIDTMDLTVRTPSNGATCAGGFGNQSSLTLEAGQTVVISQGCSGLSSGQTFSADVTITYTKSGSQLPIKSSGSISGSVGA